MKQYLFTSFLFISLAFPQLLEASDAIELIKERRFDNTQFVTQSECGKLNSKIKDFSSFYETLKKELQAKSLIDLSKVEIVRNLYLANKKWNFSPKNLIPYFKRARCERLIDELALELFINESEFQFEDTYISNDQTPTKKRSLLELGVYLAKKEIIEQLKPLEQTDQDPLPLKHFPVQIQDSEQISERQKIYTIYSIEQMKRMGELMNFVLATMDAKVETTVNFRKETQRENYVIEHTPTDIYRLGVRVYKMELKKFKFDEKMSPTNLDVLSAASELGFMPMEQISLLTSDENFYKPKPSTLSMVLNYFKKLGFIALETNPTTAPYAIIPIMLYNSYQQIRNAEKAVELDNFYF